MDLAVSSSSPSSSFHWPPWTRPADDTETASRLPLPTDALDRRMAAAVTPAGPGDAPAVRAMVQAAYAKYVARIGRRPAPMEADYERLVGLGRVLVLRDGAGGALVGALVLEPAAAAPDVLQLDNVVVDPAAQGRGLGRALVAAAERVARDAGFAALTLYTNVHMHENLGLYARMGFREVARRTEAGYERVYFRKDLS